MQRIVVVVLQLIYVRFYYLYLPINVGNVQVVT